MSIHRSVFLGSTMEAYEEKLFNNEDNPTFSNLNLGNVNMKPRYKPKPAKVGDGLEARLNAGFNYNIEPNLIKKSAAPDSNTIDDDYLANFLSKNKKWQKSFNMPTLPLDDELDDADNSFSKVSMSKTSSLQSLKDDVDDEVFLSHFNAATNNNSLPFSLPETGKTSTPAKFGKTASFIHTKRPTHTSGLNMIMFVGLFLGLLISKCLQYLQLYITWFKKQIIQLRNAFIGEVSFWDIIDLSDARFSYRWKLMLIPVIGTCSFIHGIISIMHFFTRILLTRAPNGLLEFVRSLSSDI